MDFSIYMSMYHFSISPLSLPPKFYVIGYKVFQGNLPLLVRTHAAFASF